MGQMPRNIIFVSRTANNWSPLQDHLRSLIPPQHRQQLVLMHRPAGNPGTANSWRLHLRSLIPPQHRQQLVLMHRPAGNPGTANSWCLPLPRIFPRPQATWQRQGVNFELLKQSVMHDFGVVLLFGSFFYLLPLCCWFELPPTAGQQCCFWSG